MPTHDPVNGVPVQVVASTAQVVHRCGGCGASIVPWDLKCDYCGAYQMGLGRQITKQDFQRACDIDDSRIGKPGSMMGGAEE